MTTYQQGLIDGAKMGAGQVGVALFLMECHFVGTSAEIAEAMKQPKANVVGQVFILHERGFVTICGWSDTKNSPPIYCWNPGGTDAPKPKSKNQQAIERSVANAVKRKDEQDTILADVARRATKHGHEEVKGAVRVHRMRG